MSNVMSKEAALDHCFEPREEFPKEYKPPGVYIRGGDLTEWKETDAIVHQCNCLAVTSHGLSAEIAHKYWWADPYHHRKPERRRNLAVKEHRAQPGSIQIMKNPQGKKPDVIILYAQWDFGVGDKYYRRVSDGYEDTYEEREKWFRQCLDELGKCDQYQTLAFPYKIGCGLAGGNWENYLVMINDFTFKYKKDVTLVKKMFSKNY